jgi:hypothetical protein
VDILRGTHSKTRAILGLGTDRLIGDSTPRDSLGLQTGIISSIRLAVGRVSVNVISADSEDIAMHFICRCSPKPTLDHARKSNQHPIADQLDGKR